MVDPILKSNERLLDILEERAKELNCMYAVEEALQNTDTSIDEVFNKIVRILPSGMQFPESCCVKIVYQDFTYTSDNFKETHWFISEDITVQDQVVGWIKIFYLEEKPAADEGPFLIEERRVLNSIAKRVGHYIMFQQLKLVYDKMASTKRVISVDRSSDWQAVLDLLQRTDPDEFTKISRRMLNQMVWRGIVEAEKVLQEFISLLRYGTHDFLSETNSPLQRQMSRDSGLFSKRVFEIASRYMSDTDIMALIQEWVKNDKTSFLVRTTASSSSSLPEISEALRRYYKIAPEGLELAPSARIGVRAALIRRFFTDQLEFVTVAKNFIRISDFHELVQHLVCPVGSHGKLGGKSAGVFLALRILNQNAKQDDILQHIKVPKTWYLTSDTMVQFMHYNNLEDMTDQKYKSIDDIRKEYPQLIVLFKNSSFPPEIVQGLSMALDDFGEIPLIVRSSSLLEDRLGSAFSGKYKSLFLVNQGSKNERLAALLDAIAEVYASTLGPDPMQYRAERGLTDFHEEMGIMIQEVVGQVVGDYYFPAYAGVAFSNNEFRWSPRIKREDGLIRLVPGLGTRAVDRLSDDYPILIAPGQPALRATVGLEERLRYSPLKIDVLDLRTNRFDTIAIKDLLSKFGNQYPAIEKIISVYADQHLRTPVSINTDFSNIDGVVTFEGLVSDTDFVKKIYTIIRTLQNALATPVDIEFASDGKDFYLLQCRSQSYSRYDAPCPIPTDIPRERIVFNANRFVSNGTVPNISHIVYVAPEQYNAIADLTELATIGRVIGKLNQLLPRRQFILMGPGRWGSRGDIRLGVNVTYSDINNCAVLIEIARKKGNYVPDLSFGTHFFQDLVEANIRYLPLYPDDEGIVFNSSFLNDSHNSLGQLLPQFQHLSHIIHVLEIPQITKGMMLQILMNADLDQALGILSNRGETTNIQPIPAALYGIVSQEEHWRWRMNMTEKLASQLDKERFGVKALYVVGSTQNATAQAGSDIDLLVNFKGNKTQRQELLTWLEGWSLALDEMNFLRTGYKAGGLLDVHFVTEKDLADITALENRLNLKIQGMRELAVIEKNRV
jgi:pyruvate,water dikinase